MTNAMTPRLQTVDAPEPTTIDVDISVADVRSHLLSVRLHIARPQAQQVLSLPVWIPGSYMVREFAQHLQGLRAKQGRKTLEVEALNKHQWRVNNTGDQALSIAYEVYAYDPSVRMAYVDDERAFFNGTGVVLQALGLEANYTVRLPAPQDSGCADWQLVTGLTPQRVDARGFGRYHAADYDELVDCPVTMGRMWRAAFEVRGVPHVWAITGAPTNLDGARLLRDTARIIEAEFDLWHGPAGTPPWDRYVFMMHAANKDYGGLEHRNSTALVCARQDLPRRSAAGAQPGQHLQASDGYTQLLGLISHEVFHTWNVKRLRPAEFARYDYTRENHTELLWFFEGFTSYFDDLLLRRAGLIDDACYLQLLAKTWNQVRQTPGEALQSVAQSSFDAWTKYYRITENSPNATVSYYTKGALVGLCLDAALREAGHSLDDLMRQLWALTQGGPMAMSTIQTALHTLGCGALFARLDHWVHQTAALPVAAALGNLGVRCEEVPTPLAQQLGVRVREDASGLHLTHVLRGGAAEAAGFCPGDEWLSVQVGKQHARVKALSDVAAYLTPKGQFSAWVARDGRMRQLKAQWPAQASSAMKLAVSDAQRVGAWLHSSSVANADASA